MLLKIKLTDLPPPPGSLPAWVPKCDIRAPRVPVSSLHPLSWSSTSSSFSSFLIFAFCPLSGPGSCHLVSALLAPHLSGPLPSTLSHHCPFQHRALSQASWSPEGLLTGGSPDECLFVFPDSSLLLWGADLSSGCCSTYALEKGVGIIETAFTSCGSGGWEVQGQGSGRFCIWWGPSSWYMDGRLLSMSLCGRRGEGAPWGLFYSFI